MTVKARATLKSDAAMNLADNTARAITAANVRGSVTDLADSALVQETWADVASATTTDLGAQSSSFLNITGAVTITGFGTVTAGVVKFLKFAAALTLTHNGTSLILPGGVNRVTAAGDTAMAISEGSGNWRVFSYNKASGKAVILPAAADITDSTSLGQSLMTTANQAAAQSSLGLGTAAVKDTGTSGATIPLLNAQNTWSANQIIQSTAAASGSVGPVFVLERASSSAAAGNNLGAFNFTGRNATAGASVIYARFFAHIIDATDGAESGFFNFSTMQAGTLVNTFFVAQGLYTASQIDNGLNTISAATFYEGGSTLSALYQPLPLFRALISDATGTNVATAQQWFPTTGQVTVAASTSYLMEGILILVRSAGTTSHTTGVLFGGTATLTSIAYAVQATTATGNVLTGDNSIYATAATITVVTAASTSATENIVIHVWGLVRINAGGTFIPQFQYSVAPGGAPTIKMNSFFRLTRIGSNVVASNGTWA